MDITDNEYYKGFEDEPEIQFIRTLPDGKREILSLWEGYFDRIMSASKPDVSGWKGMALHYHLHTGWYEKVPWQIPDISNAINEFRSIDVSILDEDSKHVLETICELLNNALLNRQTVWINYF